MIIYTYVVLVRMDRQVDFQEAYVITYVFTLAVEKIREVSLKTLLSLRQYFKQNFVRLFPLNR